VRSCRPRRDRFISKMVIGIGLILMGAIFALQNIGIIPWGGTFRFWPLLLMFFALVHFANRGFFSVMGHAMFLGGVALQVKSLGHADLLQQWWPVSLIWLGLVITLRSLCRQRRNALFEASCQDSCKRPS
jgi:hypothetical protein